MVKDVWSNRPIHNFNELNQWLMELLHGLQWGSGV